MVKKHFVYSSWEKIRTHTHNTDHITTKSNHNALTIYRLNVSIYGFNIIVIAEQTGFNNGLITIRFP